MPFRCAKIINAEYYALFNWYYLEFPLQNIFNFVICLSPFCIFLCRHLFSDSVYLLCSYDFYMLFFLLMILLAY